MLSSLLGNSTKEDIIMCNVLVIKEYMCMRSLHVVSNFSFVSVEIGIPFATSIDALTIYDCDAASRSDWLHSPQGPATIDRPSMQSLPQ